MQTAALTFALLSMAVVSPVLAQDSSHAPARPNILILLGDDIDRDSLGPWGGQAKTPNLDQLAKDGIRLTNVYANVAMCAPFRQELYSGRCAWRTKAMPNHSRSVAGTKSLPHYLLPLGYRVGLLGKSHIGPQEAYPFDNVGNLPLKKDANPIALKLAHQYMVDARESKRPFCLVIAAHDAHGPYTHGNLDDYPSQELSLPFDSVDTKAFRNNLSKHLAEVTNLDALLGDLRKILAEEELSDNTLVLFCSEQGNGFPFSKWTCFDDGLASGVVVALPGVIPANKTCDQMAWISDFAPTLVEAAGGTVNKGDFDGKSQWENLKGGTTEQHKYAYGAFSNCNIIDNRKRVFPVRSIRDNQYTLIWSPRFDEELTSNTTLTKALQLVESGEPTNGTDVAASWVLAAQKSSDPKAQRLVYRLHHRPEWALYDRSKDPEELNNLINESDMASVKTRLTSELQSWLEKWDDSDPVATERGFVKSN